MSRARDGIPLLLAAALLAACGDGDGDGARVTTTPTATPAATTTPAPTPEGIDPLDGASIEPLDVPATNRTTALLTDVRTGRHEGYDRIVFEFESALPGYQIGYEKRPIREDGSGDEVEIEGAHVLVVRMQNALDADLEKEGAPLTYTGPQRLRPSTPMIAEAARIGGFEGVLTWAVGVRDEVEFRVSTIDAPHRLVIDFRNH